MPACPTARSTVTEAIGNGWQSGIRSDVRLAAMMPAMRATPSASPLASAPSPVAASASADMAMWPVAVASSLGRQGELAGRLAHAPRHRLGGYVDNAGRTRIVEVRQLGRVESKARVAA